MSEQLKQAELVVNQNLEFAIGDTTGDAIPFAITGVLRRNKQDNTLFVSNIKDAKIGGEMRKVGDSYRITDDKTSDECLLRVKLSISDSRKKWAAAPEAAKLPTQNIVSNV